jgi:hypothetical protein
MNDNAKVEVVRGWRTDEPYDKNSWGTPPHILEAVREAFGGQIDCDPASNAKAQERVRAKVWYGPENLDNVNAAWGGPDGLEFFWTGRVFINPPYGKGLVQPFADILRWHYETDLPSDQQVNAHAVLTNLDTSTAWFRTFSDCSDHVVLLRDRVKFIHPITQEPVKDQQRCQILFVRNVNLEPLRKLGSVYAKA